MLLAAVIHLEALESGVIRRATGRDVHGLWFDQWGRVAPSIADRLHAGSSLRPFTLSPLMGLPVPRSGARPVEPGTRAWFRVTTLEAALSARLEADWLPRLPAVVSLGGVRWRVTGTATTADAHPWAGRGETQQLAETHLLDRSPPVRWRVTLATPTAFHGAEGHIPFPLPNLLIGSWLRRWQVFGRVRLPAETAAWARQRLAVSAYTLETVPVREERRTTIGCVGRLTLRALRMKPGERAVFSLLSAYAFWCGSGHRTTQGMGMTRVRPLASSPRLPENGNRSIKSPSPKRDDLGG